MGMMYRALLREIDKGLTQFEIAQIANLCPATAEEAKNCIPRQARMLCHLLLTVVDDLLCRSLLVKLDDDRLQEILNEVSTLRKFQN